jgi:hypothetical protein
VKSAVLQTRLFQNFSEVKNFFSGYREKSVVQEDISAPFLFNKRKILLRIFVLITSVNPLRIYVHTSGQIKIARYTGTRKRRFRGEEFTMWKTFDDLPGVVGCHQWASIWKNTENLVVRGVLTFTDKLGCTSKELPIVCGIANQLLVFNVAYDSKLNPHLFDIDLDLDLDRKELQDSFDERLLHEIYGDYLFLTGVLGYNEA